MKIGDKITFDIAKDYKGYYYTILGGTEHREFATALTRGTNTYEILEIREGEIIFDYSKESKKHFVMSLSDMEKLFGKFEQQNYEIY